MKSQQSEGCVGQRRTRARGRAFRRGDKVRYDGATYSIHDSSPRKGTVVLVDSADRLVVDVPVKAVEFVKGRPLGGGDLDHASAQSLREEILFGDGAWRRHCRYLPLILTRAQADLLSFLMNWQAIYGRDDDGWFYCPSQAIVEQAFIDPAAQKELFKSLRGIHKRRVGGKWVRAADPDTAYVEICSRGFPKRRWMRIDYAAVIRSITSAHRDWVEKYGLSGPAFGESEGYV